MEMTDEEKLRKRTRKNWKRQQRVKFRYLMFYVKLSIENATSNYCRFGSPCENDNYFALWLVAKKLEAKGFDCELERGDFIFSGIDKLRISWEQ